MYSKNSPDTSSEKDFQTRELRNMDGGTKDLRMLQSANDAEAIARQLSDLALGPNAVEEIRQLPAQSVYFGLKAMGSDEASTVLALVSQEQFTRILDYDIWPEDELSPAAMLSWLRLFGEQSPEHMALRFMNLEEEYQVAILDGLVKVHSVADLGCDIEDIEYGEMIPLPGGTHCYEIIDSSGELSGDMQALIDAIVEQDLQYAYTLLSQVAYTAPGESRLLLEQFRRARIEEDGFLSFREGQKVFVPADLQALRKKWPSQRPRAGASRIAGLVVRIEPTPQSFWEQVQTKLRQAEWGEEAELELSQQLGFVANSLAAASRIGPDEPAQLRELMGRARDLVSLGLEYLANGDTEQALLLLKAEHPSVFLRTSLALVEPLRRDLADALSGWNTSLAEDLNEAVERLQSGAARRLIEEHLSPVLGLLAAESLRGLFNRYPLVSSTSKAGDRVSFRTLSSLSDWQQLAEETIAAIALLKSRARASTATDLATLVFAEPVPVWLAAEPWLMPTYDRIKAAQEELLAAIETRAFLKH